MGERTSDEYGRDFYRRRDKLSKAIRACTNIRGDASSGKEAAHVSGLGRRPRNVEPTTPPEGEVLYSKALASKQQETSKSEWELNKGWVSRLGGERPPVGHSGLGRRLRGCEPPLEIGLDGGT